MLNGKPKPFGYQKEDILKIESFGGRSLLGHQMGLGKTLLVLWSLRRNPDWLPALVVCPASLKYNWEYEALQNIGIRASICEGRTPPRKSAHGFISQSPLMIINYDILKDWTPYFLKMRFGTIILDECQNLMNPKALRTRATQELVKSVKHVLALSGTPFLNRPVELFPIVSMLWPHEFTDWWNFVQRYCNPRLKHYGWDFTGSSNIPELRQRLLNLGMIRRRKKDVLKDLPDKMRCIVPCQLSDPSEYEYASKNFMNWLKLNHGSKVRKARKAESFVKLGYLLRLCAKLKLRSVVQQVNEFLHNTDEKIVLFAVHTKAIDVLSRRIDFPNVIIDGSISSKNRQVAVEQFQNDKRIRVLIGQHQAAGVGLTLTAASTVGVVEFGWRPGDHLQLEDRIHRIGQKKKSVIKYFAATGTIEEKMCRILQEKQQVLSAVLDGETSPEDIDLHDLLLRELKGS